MSEPRSGNGPPWSDGEMPNPDLFVESELFLAGALSTLPPFDKYHPAWALPHARQALEGLSQWVPSDAQQAADDLTALWDDEGYFDKDGGLPMTVAHAWRHGPDQTLVCASCSRIWRHRTDEPAPPHDCPVAALSGRSADV